MSILLIGIEGQLGRELAQRLPRMGTFYKTFFGRPVAGTANAIELDLTDHKKLEAVLERTQPQLIINAAAYTAVDQAESNQQSAMQLNAEAPAVIGRWAAANDAALLHYSTDYIFDGSTASAYSEADDPAPINFYGESKWAGEQAIAASGCRHCIIRTSWIYSAAEGNFLRTMFRLAGERDSLQVVSDQVGRPTWSVNLAGATLAVVDSMQNSSPGPQFQLYHYADNEKMSWYEFAIRIVAAAQAAGLMESIPQISPVDSSQYRTAAARPHNSVLDCRRFTDEFDFSPVEFDTALKRVMEQIRQESRRIA
jgi:dTDP-4-dehydrorhamnose reductase